MEKLEDLIVAHDREVERLKSLERSRTRKGDMRGRVISILADVKVIEQNSQIALSLYRKEEYDSEATHRASKILAGVLKSGMINTLINSAISTAQAEIPPDIVPAADLTRLRELKEKILEVLKDDEAF